MNPFLKTEYLTSLYEYIQQSDYLPVRSRGIYYQPDSLHVIHKNTVLSKGDSFPKVSSLKEFLDLGNKRTPTVITRNTSIEDPFMKDYFVKYFHENPSKQKDLLKFTNELCGIYLNSSYIDLFPRLFDDKKSLISALHNLPSKSFNIQGSGEIEKFHDLLKSFKLTDNEIKETFFSYYSQRQSFQKNPTYSTTSKNFLLSLYGSNNKGIDKYFPFMPFLKNEFFEINNEKDIFKKKDNFEIVSEVNLKTMLKTFSIDYYSVEKYEALIRSFAIAYGSEMGSKNVYIYIKLKKIKIQFVSLYLTINPNLPKNCLKIKC
jgi:hypothetical protein